MRKFLFINSLILFAVFYISTEIKAQKIQWLSVDSAFIRNKEVPKKMFIDVYTDWCYWCKVMEKKTFPNEKVAKYLNDNFYASRYNAESNDTISFLGETYEPAHKSSKYNRLAVEILHGQMAFPSYAFIDEEAKKIAVVPGYWKADAFLKLLIFFNKEYYKQISWDDFDKKYNLDDLEKNN